MTDKEQKAITEALRESITTSRAMCADLLDETPFFSGQRKQIENATKAVACAKLVLDLAKTAGLEDSPDVVLAVRSLLAG